MKCLCTAPAACFYAVYKAQGFFFAFKHVQPQLCTVIPKQAWLNSDCISVLLLTPLLATSPNYAMDVSHASPT